jgi:hypothetical protein
MDFALMGLRVQALIVASFLLLPVTELTGECIISQPLHVHRVCGQVLLKGSSLPGTLRLSVRDGKGGAKPFDQIGKTNDEGQFDFKDLPADNYEM